MCRVFVLLTDSSLYFLHSVGDASVEHLLLSQQPLPQRVALQDALQRRRLVSSHFLFHVEDGDVSRDT